ncbi:hypothetical protein C8R44DRAFT_877633 [Mycena epipterygia]|nr:hypothetical protein C8R44DRAFT_877633 [Mycena epipterygia]
MPSSCLPLDSQPTPQTYTEQRLWDIRSSPVSSPKIIGSAGPTTVYPAPGVPFGLSFLGTGFSDFDLISLGYAYEQKT